MCVGLHKKWAWYFAGGFHFLASFDGINVLAVETVFRMVEVVAVGVPVDDTEPRRVRDDGRFNVADVADVADVGVVDVGFCVLTDVAMLLIVRFPMPDTARRTNANLDVAIEGPPPAGRSALVGFGILNRDTMAGEPIFPKLPMLPRLARRFSADIVERAENRTNGPTSNLIRLIPLILPCLPF